MFRDLDFNDEDSPVLTPTKPSSDVLKALRQLHRAVGDFLLLSDLLTLFRKIEEMFVRVYLDPIRTQIFIKTEFAHRALSEELEFIADQAQSLFADKLGLQVDRLVSACRDLEAQKTVYIMP